MSRFDPLSSYDMDRGKTRGDSAAQADDILDLCSTCNSARLCLSKKTLLRPIHFCEEFDAYTPPPPPKPDKPLKAVQPGKTEDAGYTGICVNCERRAECVHSRDEGGIWHCEEYV